MEVLGRALGFKLSSVVALLLTGVVLVGCADSNAAPPAKTVSGQEINEDRAKAMGPEDRAKMDELSRAATVPGAGNR